MKLQLPGKKTRYWQVFWLCLLAAAALFAPHCLVDAVAGGGYFHYAGDFNDQQINFYQYANLSLIHIFTCAASTKTLCWAAS